MRKIFLYGVIGKDIPDTEFINQIPEGNEDLEIRVNSPGGSVFQGWAMHNALLEYKGKKIIHIDGVAASMASVVALAGDEVHMSENALFMIHNPSSQTQGSANDLRKEADLLDKIKNVMVYSYHKKTGIDKNKLIEMLDAETWFDANEAKESKFIDIVKGKVLTQSGTVQGHDSFKIYASFVKPYNDKKIISALGLHIGADEGEILKKIESLKGGEPTEEQRKKAKKLVLSANRGKKITADLIPHYEALAILNYNEVEALFNLIPEVTPASERINYRSDSDQEQDRSKWTLEDYRMKDPEALKNKTLFNKLLNEVK
ncbi:head maturation protease, ClpP-related [Chryseobacterium shandongense]|uniref:ATP-dependent Clp protease proteolytic subunit n=1 Tax=Chryseobacterium shandongense TaxID=1493872 RepID=A0ABM7B9D5_9FLAO|nr:head maturation protease, ClpP-related [Chryseobacterium shandongense]AZA95342.1 Clp protease ClpP [Chryseobacterium shandongense]